MLARKLALFVKKILKTKTNKVVISGKNDSYVVYVIAKTFSFKDIDQFFKKIRRGEKNGEYEYLSFDLIKYKSNIAFSVF